VQGPNICVIGKLHLSLWASVIDMLRSVSQSLFAFLINMFVLISVYVSESVSDNSIFLSVQRDKVKQMALQSVIQ